MTNPDPDIASIQQAIRDGDYQFSLHAVKRSAERRISRSEIEEAILNGEIIERYPDDKYSPSCLVLGWTTAKRPLHLQLSLAPNVKLITLYEPDTAEWIDYKTRKTT